MVETIKETLQKIDILQTRFLEDDNIAYLCIPDVTQGIEDIFSAVLPIFLEEPEENNAWINEINNSITGISEGISHRDTLKIMDVLQYQIAPLLKTLLEAFEG